MKILTQILLFCLFIAYVFWRGNFYQVRGMFSAQNVVAFIILVLLIAAVSLGWEAVFR